MNKMMQWVMAAILILSSATVLTSCSYDDNPTEQQGEYTGVPLIIYDTDIGSSTDDLFALEMLYRYEDEGRCRLLGVMVDLLYHPGPHLGRGDPARCRSLCDGCSRRDTVPHCGYRASEGLFRYT